MKTLYLSALSALCLLLVACSTSTKLVDSVVDPQWQGMRPQKVMIIAMGERRYRTPFESTFVDELRSRGYDAVASHVYAPALADLNDSDKVDEVIRQSGIDSALTITAQGLREANTDAWALAYIATSLFSSSYQERRGLRSIVAAGALLDSADAANYGLELQFFDVKTDRMIWTAKTQIFDAGDLDDLVVSLADVVIDELKKQGVIE